jgi:hypothetical protein
MEAQPGSAVGSRRRREAECDDGAEGELISASCGAVLDDPLHDLSNNHPKQDRDCEEQPFRCTSRGSGFPGLRGSGSGLCCS